MATNSAKCHVPSWLQDELLVKAMREHLCVTVPNTIERITYENATEIAENYTSLLLRIQIVVELKDSEKKTVSLILKAPHVDPVVAATLERLQLFDKEEDIYRFLLPRFEAIFKQAGQQMQFAPRSYRLDKALSEHYVLLQDLRQSNYRIGNRIKGLDLEHMRCALAKLAKFHAASACYVEQFGIYAEAFTVSIYKEENRDLLQHITDNSKFLNQLKTWKCGGEIYEKLLKYETPTLVNLLLLEQRVNAREFNVLNHGDLWTNNIMFQYDAFGKITDTLFIDYPASKYGSPALDLYYLILSSASMDIKLSQFDNMVHFYHENLVANLKLLQYSRPLPKLRNLHLALLSNGLTAYTIVSKLLPAFIYEEQKQPSGKWGSEVMFENVNYREAMSEILPWLNNRGLLDW